MWNSFQGPVCKFSTLLHANIQPRRHNQTAQAHSTFTFSCCRQLFYHPKNVAVHCQGLTSLSLGASHLFYCSLFYLQMTALRSLLTALYAIITDCGYLRVKWLPNWAYKAVIRSLWSTSLISCNLFQSKHSMCLDLWGTDRIRSMAKLRISLNTMTYSHSFPSEFYSISGMWYLSWN